MPAGTSSLTLTRGRRQSIVVIDSAGAEVCRVTVVDLACGRVQLAVAAAGELTIARGEAVHHWKPRALPPQEIRSR
jgi:hypothetical protein